MGREAEPSTSESVFLHAALAKGIRLDARSNHELRKIKLSFGTDLGWVECRLGDTQCVRIPGRRACSSSQRRRPGVG